MNPDREVNEVHEDPKTQAALKEAEVALWETRFLTMLRKVFKEANFQQLSHESMISVLQVRSGGVISIIDMFHHDYLPILFHFEIEVNQK